MHDSVIMSVPASHTVCSDAGRLILRSADPGEIVRAWKSLGERVIGVELQGLEKDVASLAELPVGLSLVVKIEPADAAQLYTNTWLADRFALAALMDVEPALLIGVKTATSALVPVILNVESLTEPRELAPVLDYYLHAPHLQVPIEFFHSMFAALVQGHTVSLTDIYPESPDRFLYVHETGQVTGSRRLAQVGRFFGTLGDTLQLEEDSLLFRMLRDPKKTAFLEGSACCSCEGFDFCTGYLRVVDAEFDCTPFLIVFAELKTRAKELAEDLAKAQSSENE
jgi:hypothetical protein